MPIRGQTVVVCQHVSGAGRASTDFFRMMFSADLGPSRRAQEGIFRACDRVFASLLAIFVEGQQAKRWRAGPAEEQALYFGRPCTATRCC